MAAGELSGQVAVITGATSGIGLASARELQAQGMRLVLSGRSADRLGSVGNELDAPTVTGDLADPATACRLLEAALFEHGRCDAVLNGAGTIKVGEIGSIDIDQVCAMACVNVEASYPIVYMFMQHFVERSSGHLINVSSVLGTKVGPTAGAYAGTKHAIEPCPKPRAWKSRARRCRSVASSPAWSPRSSTGTGARNRPRAWEYPSRCNRRTWRAA